MSLQFGIQVLPDLFHRVSSARMHPEESLSVDLSMSQQIRVGQFTHPSPALPVGAETTPLPHFCSTRSSSGGEIGLVM